MMNPPSHSVRFGPYILDSEERSLLRHGEPVRLTPKLFETLVFLVRNVGHLVEKDRLIREVWKDAFVGDGNLAHNISVLRKLLGKGAGGRNYIETIPRHGYRFIGPVEPVGSGTESSSASTQADSGSGIHSLAVLPLVNLSHDPDQEYFSDGMTEALITGLAQALPLKVISRTSVLRYKGKTTSLPTIGKELNVDALIEGSVFRSGERVRITVQLIYAPEDRHIWARSYERDLQDVLALQNDLADAIAGEIKIKLEHPPNPRGSNTRLRNPSAYEEYLKGRYCWNARTESGLYHSIEHYRNALERDPQYALAYSGLADSYALMGNRRLGDAYPQESMRLATEAATRALELDSNLAEAHLSLANLKFQYEWDTDAAEQEFRRAILLNPNAATSHLRYAMYLATMSRFNDAMTEIERAGVLDPLSPIVATGAGRILHFQRRYDEAIECHRRALAIDPDFIEAHFNLGMIYEQKAMFPEAILEFRGVIRHDDGDSAFWSAGLGHAYGLAGMEREAREILNSLLGPDARRCGVSPFDVGWVYLGLGDLENAFGWMEEALKERCGALVYQNVEPALDPMRRDARFLDLIERIDMWRPSTTPHSVMKRPNGSQPVMGEITCGMPDVATLEPLLKRICASQPFRQSHRLQRFLRYATDWALKKPGEPLKEYALAVAVYDKPASFDPQSDPIVRVEAGRLRSRLNEYYSGAGMKDDVIITLPKGSYIPLFEHRSTEISLTLNESLAVIPFRVENEATSYLVNGLCEAITRRLAQMVKIRVAPWSMVLRAQDRAGELDETANYLNVSTLVTVRLVLRGDVCELNAEWLDPLAKTHLWGAQYSRGLSELFGLEDDITFDLAGRLAPEKGKSHGVEHRPPTTNNGRAYQLYLKARHLWNKRTADAIVKAIEHYRRALDLDPAFGLAYAGMADCHLALASFTFVPPDDSLPRAKAAASRALEIDPQLGEAMTVLACVSALYEWDWMRARRQFEEAILLAPLYPVARQWYGACLCARKEFATGRKFLRSALELDQLSPMIGTQLAVGYYLEHRYGEAIRQCNSVLEIDAHFWAALLFLGLSQLANGHVEAAIDTLRDAVQFSNYAPMAVAGLGHALAVADNKDEAAELLSRLASRSTREYVPPFWLALLWCSLGKGDQALTYLEQAVEERSPTLPFWLAVEPRLDPLRRELRFQPLLQRVGLNDPAPNSLPVPRRTLQ